MIDILAFSYEKGRTEGRNEGKKEGRKVGRSEGIKDSLITILESSIGKIPENITGIIN